MNVSHVNVISCDRSKISGPSGYGTGPRLTNNQGPVPERSVIWDWSNAIMIVKLGLSTRGLRLENVPSKNTISSTVMNPETRANLIHTGLIFLFAIKMCIIETDLMTKIQLILKKRGGRLHGDLQYILK